MANAQHSIVNRTEGPIYVSIEVTPECYELEPGDRLTLVYPVSEDGDAMEVEFINERELVIWPRFEEPTVFINGKSAERRSWKFKHDPSPPPNV